MTNLESLWDWGLTANRAGDTAGAREKLGLQLDVAQNNLREFTGIHQFLPGKALARADKWQRGRWTRRFREVSSHLNVSLIFNSLGWSFSWIVGSRYERGDRIEATNQTHLCYKWKIPLAARQQNFSKNSQPCGARGLASDVWMGTLQLTYLGLFGMLMKTWDLLFGYT